jgi:predicted methyltransferase
MKKLAFLLPSLLALAACSPAAAPPPATASTPDAALDQPAETVPPQSAAQAEASRIDAALAGSWRDAGSRARDKYRHPKETLAFFGVQPGSTVIEITPGGGWYTEVLAPMLKGSGTFIAAIAADSSSEYAQKNNEKYRAKLQQHAADFGDVKLVEFDPRAPVLGTPGSADFVLTFRNVHNWASAGTAPAMFKAFFDVLKPGGVLGVVDHRAAAGAPTDKPGESGYLPTDYVIKLATDAGFTLEAQSEVNANPKDTKDYEKGVWTLPPSLTLGDTDREKYLAIGESDRMTLKFVKPAADRIFHQDVDAAAAPAKPATPAGG